MTRLLRLTRFELSKLWGRRTVLVPDAFYNRQSPALKTLLAPPFILIVLLVLALTPVVSAYGQSILETAQELTGKNKDRFKNAWSTLANSSSRGLLLSYVFFIVIAGTSMAEEAQYGTLKSVLIRPYKRSEFILAKALSLSLFVLLVVLILALSGFVAGTVIGQYGDITDPDYQSYVVSSAAEMSKASVQAYLLLIPPLFATIAYALFMSTIIEQPGYAVGVAIGASLILFALGSIDQRLGSLIFVNQLTMPLGRLEDLGLGYSGSELKGREMAFNVGSSVLSSLVFYGLSIWLLSSRDIGD